MKTFSNILALFIISVITATAQHKSNPVLAIVIQTEPVNPSTKSDMSFMLDTSVVFNAKAKIILADTNDISIIRISLKRNKSTSEILQHNFDFDVTSPGGDFSYIRNKGTVEIGLGSFSGIQHVYAEVQVEKKGVLSDPVVFRK